MGLELAASPASSANPLSVVIAGVVDGSPAEKAGVLTGDVLSAVDGEEALGADLDAVAGMLRGDPGSRVRLDVKRGSKTVAFPLTRAQFKVTARSIDFALRVLSVSRCLDGSLPLSVCAPFPSSSLSRVKLVYTLSGTSARSYSLTLTCFCYSQLDTRSRSFQACIWSSFVRSPFTRSTWAERMMSV